ncbi:MAG TPA: hypothetical protein VN721_04765 [Flavipsychrobacter sp.]|nr:hypothetical protein [Flavipsychrobacter sp.]
MLDVFDVLGKIKFHVRDSSQFDGGLWALAGEHEFDISIVDDVKEGQNKHKAMGGDAYCFPVDNYQHGVNLIDELSDHLNLEKPAYDFNARSSIAFSQSKKTYLFIVIKHKESPLP